MSQPVDLLVLTEKPDRETFWDLAFPVRDGYDWPHLFDSPVVVVPLVEPAAYVRRYSQPDKAAAGLTNLDDWPVPYWWIDGGAAVQNLLLAAFGHGLGSSLFGLFVNEAEILRAFGVPRSPCPRGSDVGYGLREKTVTSSPLPRRRLADVVHQGRW